MCAAAMMRPELQWMIRTISRIRVTIGPSQPRPRAHVSQPSESSDRQPHACDAGCSLQLEDERWRKGGSDGSCRQVDGCTVAGPRAAARRRPLCRSARAPTDRHTDDHAHITDGTIEHGEQLGRTAHLQATVDRRAMRRTESANGDGLAQRRPIMIRICWQCLTAGSL